MSDLTETLPKFDLDRQLVRRELAEKQEKIFEDWMNRQQLEQLDHINKVIAEANDAQPNANLKPDMAGQPAADAADMQRQLERNNEMRNPSIAPESRIKNAKDL